MDNQRRTELESECRAKLSTRCYRLRGRKARRSCFGCQEPGVEVSPRTMPSNRFVCDPGIDHQSGETNSRVGLPVARYGITVILMRFHFDERRSRRLRANPKRSVGFEEAQDVFSHPYYLDQRSDLPEQYRAIGWVGEQFVHRHFRSAGGQERTTTS
jgi:hypothetical protein